MALPTEPPPPAEADQLKVEEDKPPPRPVNNDFVIREGFPALRLPGIDKGPWIDGAEPLPRHDFWASDTALTYNDLDNLWLDCETVFSARAKDSDQAYSAGVTYFCPSQMKPRCALEALVLSIFQKHTASLEEGVFIPEQSGAEWWTLVLDEDEEEAPKKEPVEGDDDEEEDEEDEVGLHFDADYGLEDMAPNLMLHPRLATVTYLTNCGAPTVVLNQRSPPPNDVEKKTLNGSIRQGWLSHPQIGKHTAFDGRLLHGAPASFFPSKSDAAKSAAATDEPPLKKTKTEQGKRITLLVNIWLNHCPMDAEPLEDEICDELKTPFEVPGGKTDDSFKPPFVWESDLDLDKTAVGLESAKLDESTSDPAGEDEYALCSRAVTVSFGASAESFREASAKGGLVELEFGKGALTLEVGEVIKYDDDSDEEGAEAA